MDWVALAVRLPEVPSVPSIWTPAAKTAPLALVICAAATCGVQCRVVLRSDDAAVIDIAARGNGGVALRINSPRVLHAFLRIDLSLATACDLSCVLQLAISGDDHIPHTRVHLACVAHADTRLSGP